MKYSQHQLIKTKKIQYLQGRFLSFITFNIPNSAIQCLQEELAKKFQQYQLPFEIIHQTHISFSKLFHLQYHKIANFIELFQRKYKKQLEPFRIGLNFKRLIVLRSKQQRQQKNTNKVELFVCIQLQDNRLNKMSQVINQFLKQYKIQPYYSNPIFHISIIRGYGQIGQYQSVLEYIQNEKIPKAKNVLVKNIEIKIGNKKYNYTI